MKILSEEKTIDFLKKGWSLARYGDGELHNLILKNKDISKLQDYDPILREKLLKVLRKPHEKLLIGIPYMETPKKWVNKFHNNFKETVKDYEKLTLCSAFVSRPSVIGKDNDDYFKNISDIWKGKFCVIINFNLKIISHPLIKTCNRADFIKIPRRNCFSEYRDILERCSSYSGRVSRKDVIFLVSAGPTATVLSYDLTILGFQCIDIGQIVFEYDLYNQADNVEKWTSQNEFRRKT